MAGRGRRPHVPPQAPRVERVCRARKPTCHPAAAAAIPAVSRDDVAQALARGRHVPESTRKPAYVQARSRKMPSRPRKVTARACRSPRERGERARRAKRRRTCPRPSTIAETDRLSRRSTLVRAGGLAAAAVGLASLPAEAAGATAQPAPSACVLSPEMTEGPVLHATRRCAATSPRAGPGAPLSAAPERPRRRRRASRSRAPRSTSGTRARAASTRARRPTTRSGRTFLRGDPAHRRQRARALQDGLPRLVSGPRVHIHVKVHVGGDVVHTGQLFFRDAFTDVVYKRPPYEAARRRDVRNSDDSIFLRGGQPLAARHAQRRQGLVGSISMGVRRGRPSAARSPKRATHATREPRGGDAPRSLE